MRTLKTTCLLGIAASAVGCASGDRGRFPLREPMWQDGDLASVNAACHEEGTAKDPHHVSCAPAVYKTSLYWDGADNLFYRPLSEMLGVVRGGESVNVNSMDEVPDSSWFTNRPPPTPDELRLGACTQNQILDPEHAADGTWIIDKGKTEGETPGFRINVPGKGKYMVKAEDKDNAPERMAASSVIGAAVYHAAGYNAACEQVIYVRPSVFKLMPGLVRRKNNFADIEPFDQKALDAILSNSTTRNGLVRLSASAWIPGYSIGAYRFVGTRDDDPNDVVNHEDRRELRGMRLLAAWIDRHDAREGNTFDSWMADNKDPPDSSPGHVIHYQLDTSETLGSLWAWDQISKRLGQSYIIDWGDAAGDFFSLGAMPRPWDTVNLAPGREIFGYYDVEHFDPDTWKNEYPNKAFSRMTEHDGAWMARVLARFTPELVSALAEMGGFTDHGNTTYLASIMQARLDKILQRYLLRLSPIADVRLDGEDTLCGTDLAEMRRLRAPTSFMYRVSWQRSAPIPITLRPGGKVCLGLPHPVRFGVIPYNDPQRYVKITITDGVAKGPLVVHLYDLDRLGYRLVGVERPDPK